jgi:predicted negative regulator of RcsB-dependent stress response
MSDATLIVALEGLLIFGGVMAFGIWQLHSIKKDQEAARRQRNETPANDKESS